MAKKPGRPLTLEERDNVDNQIFEFEIERGGKRFRMTESGEFVPISGSKAQELTSVRRKPKVK